MSRVFLAHEAALKRDVVIKVLPAGSRHDGQPHAFPPGS